MPLSLDRRLFEQIQDLTIYLHTPLDTMQCLNVSTPSIPSCISKSTQGKAASDYKPYAVNSQKFLLELFTEFGIQWCWQEFSPPWTWQIECSCSPHKASIIHFLLSKKTYFPSCTYLFFHTLLLFVYVFFLLSVTFNYIIQVQVSSHFGENL